MKASTGILFGVSFFIALIAAIYFVLPVATTYLRSSTAGAPDFAESHATARAAGRWVTIRSAQEPSGNINQANCFVYVGEPAQEFLSCCFRPDRVNRTVTANGTEEQWCYGEFCSTAFYFTNGVLTGFQERD